MKLPVSEAFLFATFAVALVAAVFDWRTRRIPNLLTVGGLVLAVPLHLWLSPGLVGLQSCALGGALCAMPAVAGWWLGWVSGGDVKLIAAMGAMGGVSLGVEAVFLSVFCALGFVLLRLAWEGAFLRTIGNGVAVAATRAVSRRKLAAAPAFTSEVRFGPFAVAGAALSLFLRGVLG
jgi:prepilin peptidase CpaA